MWRHGPPQYPEFVAASAICCVIILLPISSHWKARNVATLSMIWWLFTVNFYRVVNSIIWANNVDELIPVWCDITTKLTVGCQIAIPASALCICRYLEAVASVRFARQTETQKRNRRLFELFMCFGLPLIFMGIHYISQGHRYDIIEHIGCNPTAVKSWVAVVTLYVPPIILTTIALVYAALAIRHFYRRRVDFKKHLSASNSGISASRYVRLMALALTEILVDTAFSVFVLWLTVTPKWGGLLPWTGWADVHSHFSRVQQIPLLLIPPAYWALMRLNWWLIPMGTIIFWAYFAFGQESMAEYRGWWNWVKRVILRRKDVLPLGSSFSNTRVGQQSSQKGNKLSSGEMSAPSGPRITIPRFPFRSQKSSSPSSSKGNGDGDSFVSADEFADSIMKQPISPISPSGVNVTPKMTYNGNAPTPSYVEPELDMAALDSLSIGNVSVGEAEDADQHYGSYQGYIHQNESATFASTAVRANTPNVHTNDVRVEVATDVV